MLLLLYDLKMLIKQIIDASIPLTYLSREVIHITTSLAQQYNSHLLFAMNKVDLVKQKQVLEERKQLIINEIPELLRPSVYIKNNRLMNSLVLMRRINLFS